MGGTRPRQVGRQDRRALGRGSYTEATSPPPPPAMGCFVPRVTERPWGCSRRRTSGFCSVSSSLYWNSPPPGLRCAPPGACAKDALDTTSPRVALLHRGLSGLPFPRGLEQPLLLGEFSSSAPGMLASSLSWTLDKALGDLFTQPWGKKNKLLQSVFGLSDRACFRIQKGLEGVPPWNMGRHPLP